jgi:DNA-binding LytR/AlgR family response regulator
MKKLSCIIVDDNPVMTTILRGFAEKSGIVECKQVFNNPQEAYSFLNEESVDIMFLDIEMPQLSGIELLKSLKNPPATILVTANPNFAAEAFELDAVDYIVKPPEFHRFLKALNKAQSFLKGMHGHKPNGQSQEEAAGNQEIFVKIDQKLVKVRLNDIMYIEAMADYVVIHTTTGRQLVVYSSMKNFEAELEKHAPGRFRRIHRSYIIDREKVEAIEDNSVVIGKKYIPIGKTYREEFLNQLNKL